MNNAAFENLYIAATADSPEVDFRFNEHLLALRGESYPENAAAFYGDVIARTRAYLASVATGDCVTVNIALAYFNSSSTKMLFSLFDALNSLAKTGSRVVLNWHHDPDDDTIQEFGFELRDDFAALEFHDIPTEG
jgi:SiaC family regulatory phosphoprotein